MTIQFNDLIENIPQSAGVYQMFDSSGALLYVGKAKNLSARLKQYVNMDKLSYHKQIMRRQVVRVDVITTATESDALLLESDLIKNAKPKYNILLTDDKMYPMLALTSDPFPRLYKFRGRAIPKKDVFGPYSGIGELNQTIKLIQKVCKLRTCTNSFMNNRTRPCLLYQIGRCSAPCMASKEDNLSKLNESYAVRINIARKILSGDTRDIINDLALQMKNASDKQDFESAAKIRDSISALSGTAAIGKLNARDADFFVIDDSGALAISKMRGGQVISHQIIRPKNIDDMTPSEIVEQAILYFNNSDREKNKIRLITNVKLENLQADTKPNDEYVKTLLGQLNTNRRIFTKTSVRWNESVSALEKWLDTKINAAAVFDNSHLFGKNPVGSMIVFGHDGFIKSEYRHFKLENKSVAGNDIGMMNEFVSRAFAKERKIDLVIVDGGRAQWNIAMDALKLLNLDIPVIGVTKGEVRSGDEHFILPDGKVSNDIAKNSELFLLMRAVRDEAHRFAISFHRKTRAKSMVQSALDDIEGIGNSRRMALLRYFGGIDKIADADVGALSIVPGISKSVAEKIYLYFHPESV